MYLGLLALLLALSAWLAFGGFRDGSRLRLGLGVVLGLATVGFFASLTFWGEMLWFDALGYGERFWSAVGFEAAATVGGALFAGLLAFGLSLPVRDRRLRLGAAALATTAGALWGYGAWDVILRFLYRVPAGIDEPILDLDAGFYLFTLPFLDAFYGLLLTCTVIAAGAAVLFTVLRSAERVGEVIEIRRRQGLTVHPAASRELEEGSIQHALGRTAAAVAVVLALGRLLAVPHLLFSSWGAVSGPGWTDVHVRLPALVLVAAVTAGLGALLAFRGARHRFAG